MKHKILLVDDELANLRVLTRLFRDDFEPMTASSGEEALKLLSQYDFALIISDQRMPGMNGIEFLKRAAAMRQQTVRIILTGHTDIGELVDVINSGVIYKYITKPWVNADLLQTVTRGVEHYESGKNHHLMAAENGRLESRLGITVCSFADAVVEMIGVRNPNLAQHSRRTATVATQLGNEFNFDPPQLEQLHYASLLHEVPNIRLPFDLALNKSALTAAQLGVTRLNYENGLRLISRVPDLEEAAAIILNQHEHFDGTGYFNGLDGDVIPLASRILAVASAFDELTARNPQNNVGGAESAERLTRRGGTDFDPEVVAVCLSIATAERPTLPIGTGIDFREAEMTPAVR